MSDTENKEVQVENQEVQTEENQNQEAQPKELSAIEQKAIEMGWRPQEDFDGDEEDFIDAKEFVRRKPLFDKIDHVGKELKETRKALKALQEHHAKVRDAEYKHALEQLRKEKKQALEEGDADRLVELDEQIAEAKAQEIADKREAVQQAQAPHPNFVQWVNKNPWYKENAELQVMANQIGTAYAASNPTEDPDAILVYVEKRIKKLYPEHFRNPNKDKPSAVEGRRNGEHNKPAPKEEDYPMSDEERKIMMTFVRSGAMSKEEYIADLKRIKGE